LITTIEELSLNAWPSLQTMSYDGWILRFAEGYTKRANSANPLYSSSIDIDEKIRFCEYVYQKRNLPTVFKMTSSVYPGALDEKLHAKGYQIDSPTSVQTIDLDAVNLQRISETEFQDDLSDAWLENYCRMNTVPIVHIKTLQKILINIIPNHSFVSIRADNRIVACGLGVQQSGYIGLFDIVTDKDFRNRGYGQQIVTSILDWGKQNQAQTGYLQVMLENIPALRLYSKLGFVEQYQYWYRIKRNLDGNQNRPGKS
jgi:ribosomal protein S18 acetylase RimI-like enzyme